MTLYIDELCKTMIIKNWLKGPWYDDAGVRHEGTVPGKFLPVSGTAHRNLIGIVDCVTGVGQGFTARGVPLYLCYPLRADYPPFLVAIKDHYKTPPIVRFNYEHWEGKWPRGGITTLLGLAGEKAIEHQALLECIYLPRSYTDEPVTCNTVGYDTTPWSRVINIDPDGCQDVDDILCWRFHDAGVIEFAIGIADVAAWIPTGSALDKDAALRATTMYENGVPVDPMLPTMISTTVASLRTDGVARPVLALVYRIGSEGNVLESPTWSRIVTSVHTCYTYDSVLCTEDATIVRQCVSALRGNDIGSDSHLWIEQLMIAYNAAAARVIAGRGILRAHSGVTACKELAVRTGVPEIEFLGGNSGRYTSDVMDSKHNGLGLDLYCHASSPLRRYADLVNQRWIKSILFGDSITVVNPNLSSLNERCGVIKRMERFLWFLTNISTESITTVGGHIVTIKGAKVRVYVPKLRRVLKGVVTEEVILGDPVKCRIWCNRRACTLDNRYVVQVSK